MSQVRLLQPWRATDFRNGGMNEQGNGFEAGVATGRARCRACGEPIAKGEQALVGYYDFSGNYGSWTSVRIWIHQNECQANAITN